jgi:uncharacterized protein (DUF2126 family)/transglutaminase-like putative cysteine protease
VSIHVALNHVTHYRYDRPVNLGPQVIRLRPCAHARTRILSYSMKVTPGEHFINWQQDPQANYLARLVFPEKTTEFRIEVDFVAEMAVHNPFDFFLEPRAEEFPFSYPGEQAIELQPYRACMTPRPQLNAYLRSIPCKKVRTIDFLVGLNQRIHNDIRYTIRMEPGVQTPEETLTKRSGSCRDSAWLMVQVARHLGLAARFVSGYLIQLAPDIKSLDGPSGPEIDFTDLHAWCEVYLPGAGWIGLDPTSGLLAGEGHIPVACSPDPGSAAPVTGGIDKCECEFEHSMSVSRIWEAPRVTKPYSDDAWLEIDTVGEQVDLDLQQLDVRLTQGGEPTFVSVDDRDGAEWNTEAMGPTKRILSASLLDKLRSEYAPFGLRHYGQGKWYPGEQLPRWSLNIFWRKDGEPLWVNPTLVADESLDYGVSAEDAGVFLRGVAERLNVLPKWVFPAFEDVWYYLWRERRLPENVDPFDSRLDDELERDRLRKVYMQGLDKTIGQVLPIARSGSGPGWESGPWFLRDERCYLIPGDSPIGYRLPLDSQPWVSRGEFPYVNAEDPSIDKPALPSHAQLRLRVGETKKSPAEKHLLGGSGRNFSSNPLDALKKPAMFESAAWVTRTFMCAEPRGGKLYIFMPPTTCLEDYLEVLAAVEATAEAMGLPVIIEGYEPPRDARLTVLRVTPDPGVIEVNVQPAANWSELTKHTNFLYEAAHQTRLSTEKFMVDGRHTGTGGGNHFVLGGATPSDSPFLRRPDLLASMVAYWHNHPALSYLFSGLFIGPTSQAPRVDEARHESVRELEVAFEEMRRQQSLFNHVPPWMVDRALRNLLVDVTGNTHRAEFCIDKLYSPDSSTGRLGLLEMRAFEMPPHARMSLAQQLLMRALVARFWKTPYQPSSLIRWGTGLHDRYMLPHFIWADLCDVIEELNQAGYAFKSEWFAPHFEFRFPHIGEMDVNNVRMDIRMALEPWHVMGEEGMQGGTVRYVDSSLERIQIKVNGYVEGRHVVTCNGEVVPLHPTGTQGEYVAGVRYRAWQPPNCLHPTIGVHAPLTFDLVDTWMHRSLGGCQYHVAHPGGRNYDTFPVNAYEAEARRLARFFRIGHTPGEVRVDKQHLNPDFPFTLDLRLT